MCFTADEALEFCRNNEHQIKRVSQDFCDVLVKYDYDDNTIVLFGQYSYHKDNIDAIDERSNLEYKGFYSKVTDKLYDCQYKLNNADNVITKAELNNEIESKVTQIVNKLAMEKSYIYSLISDDDKKNIKQPEESDIEYRCYRYFVDNLPLAYSLHNFSKYDNHDVISYVNNPKETIVRLAKQYVANNAKKIYETLLLLEATKKEIDKIKADKNHEYHYICEINKVRDKVREVAPHRKNVDITIDTEQGEITVRYPVDYNITTNFSSCNLSKADRELYDSRFIFPKYRHEAKDVVKVVCGKHVLYDRSEFERSMIC